MSDFVYVRLESGRVGKRRFRSEAELRKTLDARADELSDTERVELEKMADSAARRRGGLEKGFNYFKRAYLSAFGRIPVAGAAFDTFSEWDARSSLLTETRLAWMAEQAAMQEEFDKQELSDKEKAALDAGAKETAKADKAKSKASEVHGKHSGLLASIGDHALKHVATHLAKEAALSIFKRGMERLQGIAATGEEGRKSTAETAAEVEQAATAIKGAADKGNAIAQEAAPVLDKWTAALSSAGLKQRAPNGLCRIAKDRLKWAVEELARRVETGEATARSVAKLDEAIASGLKDWNAGLAKAQAE